MKIIQSLWTTPMLKNRWGVQNQLLMNLWLYALSINYIKKLNIPTVLYTDDLGKEIFNILPYDEIKILPTINNSNEYLFWAQCKYYTLMNEEIGSIHVDGDIFLKNFDNKLIPILNFSDHDLIVQNMEDCNRGTNDGYYKKFEELFGDDIKELLPKNKISFNTGVVGFNNYECLIKYYNGYQKYKSFLLNDKNLKFLIENGLESPDLVLEQMFLSSLSNQNNYKVKIIIPSDTDSTINDVALDIGYTHLLGGSKYTETAQNAVKKKLMLENIELYNNVNNKINDLINDGNFKY